MGRAALRARPVAQGTELSSAPTVGGCTVGEQVATARKKTTVPGIYKRGTRYEVTYRHRGAWKGKGGFRTLADAREFKARANAGLEKPQGRETFEDYAREWLSTYRGRTSRGIKPRSLNRYREIMERHVLPFFKGYRLAEIERPDVRRFYSKLEAEGRPPGGVRKIAAPLKAMFATAVEDGLLQVNPAENVRIMGARDAVEETRERALTRVELAAFLDALPAEWRFFFEFLTQTGLRISEAIGLTVGDIAFGERPRIKLRRQLVRGEWDTLKTKAGKRDVPLSPALSRALWTRCAGRPADAPLFASERGTHLREENVRHRVLAPARKAAGLTWDGFGFHTFRHTCASLLFESGKNVLQVSRWLGHEDPAFTLKTYVHLLDAGLGEAAFFDAEIAALTDASGGNKMSTQEPGTSPSADLPLTAETA